MSIPIFTNNNSNLAHCAQQRRHRTLTHLRRCEDAAPKPNSNSNLNRTRTSFAISLHRVKSSPAKPSWTEPSRVDWQRIETSPKPSSRCGDDALNLLSIGFIVVSCKANASRYGSQGARTDQERERRSKNSQEISANILLIFFCFRNCSGVPRQENDNLWSSCANNTHLQLVVAATEAESSLETSLYTRAADPQAIHKRSTMSPPNEQPEDDFVTKVGRT